MKETLLKIRSYNKSISTLLCSDVEKHFIKEVSEREYFYSFSLNYNICDYADVFIKQNKGFKNLVKHNSEKLCFYLKQLSRFTCNKNIIRMDARSTHFSYYTRSIHQAISNFYLFTALDLDIQKGVYGEYRKFPIHLNLTPIIATELLLNNEKVIQYCKDVLTSENNTAVLTRDVICAIEQSKNKELQDLLIQVLKAAKLQEGLRQSIMETCDENDIDFFYRILDVIQEENLLRFSSVQRAILTWIGIGYEVVEEKQIYAIFDSIYSYIHDENKRIQALSDINPIHVYLSLYVQGIKDVDIAIEEAISLLKSKERHLVACALIYLKLTNHFDVLSHTNIIEEYKEDAWIMALYVSECIRLDYPKLSLTKVQIQTIFNFLLHKAISMKAQEKYTSKGFEWFHIELYKTYIANILLKLMECDPSKDKSEKFLPLVSSLNGSRTNEFMESYFPYVSLEIKKPFMLKEIISSNEDLSKQIYKEYLNLHLSEEDIIQLESRLKSKKSYVRAHIVKIIAAQKKEIVQSSYQRLSQNSAKTFKEAALELKQNVPSYFEEEPIKKIDIVGVEQGFTLYTPKSEYPYSYPSKLSVKTKGLFKKQQYVDISFFQSLNKEEVMGYLKLWNNRIKQHAFDEYEVRGEYRQVGNRSFFPLRYNEYSLDVLPLGSLWRQYFKEDHLNNNMIFQLMFQIISIDINFDSFMSPDIKIFTLDEKDIKSLEYWSHVRTILRYYYLEHKKDLQLHVFAFIELMNKYSKYKQYRKQDYQKNEIIQSISSLTFFSQMLAMFDFNEMDDSTFTQYFPLYYESYLHFHLHCREETQGKLNIPLLYIARAINLKLLPKEALYEAILDTHTCAPPYKNYSVRSRHRLFDAYRDAYYKGRGLYGKPDFSLHGDENALKLLRNCLDHIVDTILPMECGRYNEETAVSDYVKNFKVILGVRHLISAIKVLEGEDIKRNTYGSDRNTIFTNVIRNCYPIKEEDNVALLKNANIEEKRLVEIAMLSPQWIDIIAQVIQWDGFKEACYYFIAHMKDYDHDHKKAEIAKYTELDPIDLNDGAFDLTWCKEVYTTLGEKRFTLVYNAAKFLCDNAFHTRARKYADAAMGKVGKEEFIKQVEKSRNKDALNAYCIIPLKDDKDLLERYLYIQSFLKESKKYGAQRQASEARSAEIAFINLAHNSRFESVTRLSWMMESENIKQYAYLLEKQSVEDIEVNLCIDEYGRNEIEVYKNGKKLKSVPSKYAKHEKILLLKEIHKKWKEQYQRSKAMLEEAMEQRTAFTKEELDTIMNNPIVSPMLQKLVLCSNNNTGFYKNGSLQGPLGTFEISNEIKIAHPFDLYTFNVWHTYQEYIFNQKIVQPFKQVFRELYLKLEDELKQDHTKRYSGYQIQIQKTKGALKSRKWNVSYESGLEKICYKDNIIAHLYADADWFSPSDIEAPSIDYVHFTSRKDYKSVLVKDINDILFSEIMRDVDLAVSVAYVGGVDPITSFSTIELRKTIVDYTCKLMKLYNVTTSDHFANIKGTLNDYSVHLGSGMVHQSGGSAIHILPVHSEKRGKLYLPFLDEDPTCATILSKIILLAEDHKIKDPSILEQIITKK